MDWQPIETAPKDGTMILVWDGRTVEPVEWREKWYLDKSNPGWMIANCDEEYGYYIKATHWMPLPDPPPTRDTQPQSKPQPTLQESP